ncbi:MAG: type II toxin-antitoxin system HicA family toxin [Daejeonella sp.]|uniref:type II toxin-antitoxin system HicA family toxin n=1 Tax=Daejeonella sp. TaxID=2805397 RepID=UPI003C758C3A
MKLNRNISGRDLVKLLSKFGYEISRQKGSHIRMTRKTEKGSHHITVPDHNPLKLGTLSGIIADVALQLGVSKEEILN